MANKVEQINGLIKHDTHLSSDWGKSLTFQRFLVKKSRDLFHPVYPNDKNMGKQLESYVCFNGFWRFLEWMVGNTKPPVENGGLSRRTGFQHW